VIILTLAQINRLALAITSDLFVDGCGERASRLVLEHYSGRNLGGWCQAAVQDVIIRHLKGGDRQMGKTKVAPKVPKGKIGKSVKKK